MDYAALLYDPIYRRLGVPAQLTSKRPDASAVTVVVIDKTAGIDVSGALDMMSLRPAALVRAREVLDQGVQMSELDGGSIQFNEGTWLIDQHHMKPSPHGERDGEVMLFLTDESHYG